MRLQVIDWQLIVDKHGQSVWQTAYRLLGTHSDSADCFQETFICALEVAKRQRVWNFSALLVSLATSRAIDRLRQRFRDSKFREEAVDLVFVPNKGPGPVEQLQVQELAGWLRRSLAQLRPQEAQVFCLRFLNGMSYRRIAKEVGITTSATGVLLHRARRKLQDFFEVT
ncbi:MAG: RNA polymerase sigma factor [Planctomycetota bacterium]|jgi:RNA polymerase sigma-70 factor (ECF subfamily)